VRVIKNALVQIEGRFEEKDIVIDGGIITAVNDRGGNYPGAEITDASGLWISSGLCDIHTHLREPGFGYKETIASGSLAGAAGGYTTLCAMPNLNPVPDSAEHMRAQLDIIEKDAVIRVLPYASITVGQKGQELSAMEELAPLCCAFSDDGKGVQRSEMMAEAMKLAAKLGKPISAHCEDESLIPKGGCVSPDAAERWNCVGIPPESEYAQVERDIELAKQAGCVYNVCHVSCVRTVEAVKAADPRITCEVSPHHLYFCDEDINADDGRFRMNPPLRTREDMMYLRKALAEGDIAFIATDHAPHSAEEKAKKLAGSAFGITGIETALSAVYSLDLMDPAKLLFIMSDKPRRWLGLESGIKAGARADLMLFDPNGSWEVDPDKLVTKGKSTPFAGLTLRGKVIETIYGGKTVWKAL